MDDQVRVEQSTGRPIAVIRKVVVQRELPKFVPEACGTVWNAIKQQKAQGAGRNVAVYLDDKITTEAGVEFDGAFSPQGDVILSALPAGSVVTARHTGPYGTLNRTYETIDAWFARTGRKRAGPSWEVYGHWQEEWNSDPSKIITDIYFLLAE